MTAKQKKSTKRDETLKYFVHKSLNPCQKGTEAKLEEKRLANKNYQFLGEH